MIKLDGSIKGIVTTASDVLLRINTPEYIPLTLSNQTLSIDENTDLVITLGPVNANGNQVVYTIVGETDYTSGPASNQITFNSSSLGAHAFTVQGNDGTGNGTTSATITVTVNEVAQGNSAPSVSGPVTLTSMTNTQTLTFTEAQLLANATDSNGDSLSVVSVSSDSGTLIDNKNGSWDIYPVASFTGQITISYSVTDGTDSTPATATIAVSADSLTGTSAAVTKFLSGQSSSIAYIGDSTTVGYGAPTANRYEGSRDYGQGKLLSDLIIASGRNSQSANMCGDQNVNLNGVALSAYDARVDLSGAAVNAPSNTGFCGGAFALTFGSIVFDVDDYDTVEIIVGTTGGGGTGDVYAGATLLGQVSSDAADGMASFTFNTGLQNEPITITQASGTVYLFSINAYNSAKNSINIEQYGHAGATAATLANNNNFYAQGAIPLINADTTIINLGINDWVTNVTPAAYRANLQNLITKVLATGSDIVLCTPFPSASSAASIAEQDAIVAEIRAEASVQGCPLVDFYALVGSYVDGDANGYYSDTYHPNAAGYALAASTVFDALFTA